MAGSFDKAISDIRKQDSLADAEKLTGESYKTSKLTSALGFGLHIQKVQDEQALAEITDDTTGDSLEHYLKVAKELGFEVVGNWDFVGREYPPEPVLQEKLFLLWHRDKYSSLEIETYAAHRVNKATLRYAWQPPEGFSGLPGWICSGGMRDGIWCGYHHADKFLRNIWKEINETGELVPWPEFPFMQLVGYSECLYTNRKGSAFDSVKHTKQLTAQRLETVPGYVREGMGLAAIDKGSDLEPLG